MIDVVQGVLLVFLWWFWIQVMGVSAWPLSRRFFRSFPDDGYLLSKGLGLILVGFTNWFLVSLHILPFSIYSVVLSILIIATASWFLRTDSPRSFGRFLLEKKRMVLMVEIVFLLAFIGFAFVRMGNPDIAQTEKMPDYAFLTGIVNSEYFPPGDPWFADGTINYFYYGHYLVGLLTKVSAVAPEYGYNLGIAMIFAMSLLISIGITFGLLKRLWYSIIGGLFVAFIGNLDCSIQFFSNLGEIVTGDKKLYPFTWFNWWMSSRVIVREGVDITINEFPFWSYILGDLHAHMNVVPISLMVLAVILELFRDSGRVIESLDSGKDKWFRLILTAVVLGAIPCANTWDTPTYFALIVAALLLGRQFTAGGAVFANLEKESISMAGVIVSPASELFTKLHKSLKSGWKTQAWGSILFTWLMIAAVIACAIALYLPFHLHFHPAGTQGLRIVDPVQYTLIGDFLTIYGFFFYCMFPFALALVARRFIQLNERLKPLAGISLIILFFAFMMAFDRFMIAFCLFFLFFVLAIPLQKKDPDIKEKFFVLALTITVLVILLGCEFFYIKDAYGKTLERQNTIFKFYYQAWILCGISSAYAVFWMREKSGKILSNIWEPGFRILFLCTLMFPFIASSVKTGNFRSFSNPTQYSKPTLDGMFYMTWQYKGDFAAIHWLRNNSSPGERVLEATGPAFSHYGRISAGTGMATILGWGNHQNIWRDGSWKMVNARSADVKKAYTSGNQSEIREVLDRYKINYVYYGKLEREQYSGSSPNNFAFMEKVMEIADSDGKASYLFRYARSDS